MPSADLPGLTPEAELPVSFALLLNLASVSNTEDKAVLWGFIRNYAPGSGPKTHKGLDRLVIRFPGFAGLRITN